MSSQEYQKVYNSIKSQILAGRYAGGQKLAPERLLCEQYGVSRITARHALRLLEDNGLVERFQGKGTFIKSTKPAKLPITELGFAKSVKDYAPGLYRNLLKKEITKPPSEIAKSLQLDDEKCLLAVRADLLNREIIAFDKAYIRQKYSRSITAEILRQVDFFERWSEIENLRVSFYRETVEAVEADTEMASILNIRTGDAVLRSTEVYYDSNNNPIAVFISYYRGDRIKLTSTVNFKGKSHVKISDY